MKRPILTPSMLVLVGASLARCSSTPTPPPTPPTPPPTPVVQATEAPPDLTAVPAPDTLIATVRARSPRGLIRGFGERLGLQEMVQGIEQELPSVFGDDEQLARTVDLDAPADIVVYLNPRGRGRAVIAFGAVSMPRAEDALSQGHRLTAMGNGVRKIERIAHGDECPEGPQQAECVVASSTQCALTPTVGDGNPARLVCADRFGDIEPVVAYLARTLPRTPLAQADGDLVVALNADGMRHALDDDARELANGLPELLVPRPDPNNPALQGLVRDYARDQLAASLTAGLNDLGGARLALRFADGATTLHGELSLRAMSAPIVQRVVTAARDIHPTAEALNRLPPGGAMYGAAAGQQEALRPELNLAGPVLARLAVSSVTLPPADATALRTAITAALQPNGSNRFQSATCNGTTNGSDWHLGTYTLDAPAAPLVTRARALLTALRRPAVAAAIHREWHLNPATLRTPPTPGLPAGTLFAQFPLPATLERAARERLGVGAATTYELLLVPDGNTLWTAWGADVRARYREARAAHPPPLALPELTQDGVLFGGAMLPMGLARLLTRFDPQIGRTIERALQSNAAATAPMTGYVRFRPEGDGAVFSGDFHVPDAVLGALGSSFRQTP